MCISSGIGGINAEGPECPGLRCLSQWWMGGSIGLREASATADNPQQQGCRHNEHAGHDVVLLRGHSSPSQEVFQGGNTQAQDGNSPSRMGNMWLKKFLIDTGCLPAVRIGGRASALCQEASRLSALAITSDQLRQRSEPTGSLRPKAVVQHRS